MFLNWQDYNCYRQHLFSTCQAYVCMCMCVQTLPRACAYTASKNNTSTRPKEDAQVSSVPLFSGREAVSAEVFRVLAYMAIQNRPIAHCYKNLATISSCKGVPLFHSLENPDSVTCQWAYINGGFWIQNKIIKQWFSECGSQVYSISIAWEFARNADSWDTPDLMGQLLGSRHLA